MITIYKKGMGVDPQQKEKKMHLIKKELTEVYQNSGPFLTWKKHDDTFKNSPLTEVLPLDFESSELTAGAYEIKDNIYTPEENFNHIVKIKIEAKSKRME